MDLGMKFDFDVTNKEKVFEYLSKPGNNVNGRLTREVGFSNNFQFLYEQFIHYKTNNEIDEMPFIQRLWYFLQNLVEPIKCHYCGDKITPFNGFKYGHQKYCCISCMNKDEEHKDNVNKGIINNFGTFENYINVRNHKSEITCMKKYGIKNAGGTKESIEKGRLTKIQKYGSLNNCYELIENKKKDTIIQKYGSLNEFNKIASEKRDESNRHNHNGILYMQTEEGKKYVGCKSKETNRHNFLERVYKDDCNVISINENNILLCKCYEDNCNECCDKKFEIPYHIYMHRKNKDIPLCYKKYNRRRQFAKSISKNEKELLSYISSIYKGNIIENDRNVLNGKEIDIYLPDKKIGFEYNGDFWHCNPDIYDEDYVNPISHKSLKESVEYDNEKKEIARKKDILLVIVWENDWINDNVNVKQYINRIINEKQNRG